MRRREFIAGLALPLLARGAWAQSTDLPIVGVLRLVDEGSWIEALREGLRDNGFVDGVNGLRMHVLEAGFETPGRPALLLIHGYP